MMQRKWWQRLLPHAIALLIYVGTAVVYCRPAFQHKVLVQEDITQWRAMSRSSFLYREQHGHFPLWTESMFSGMPAYLIAMEATAFAPQPYVTSLVSFYLPKPASFFVLACIAMYFLTQVLRVNPYAGIISGLAYAYATYNPVIISVGHDTKMQAIALLPAFIAGLMLIYEKKYGWGAALTALCTAMIVDANHLQIFYYGLIVAGCMTAGYAFRWVRNREWKHLLITALLASACGLTGILCNAVAIFTTADLSRATIRGGSELAANTTAQKGLSEDYAFSYSLYPNESFILMVPKMYGGSSGPELAEDHSKAQASLKGQPAEIAQAIQQQDLLTFYWGGIGGTAGPAYAGAVVCFLALLGMFVLDNTHKWWMAATVLLTLLMSWGGYFPEFNRFLYAHLPMYNKFRAPSVILVIPVFLLNMLAALTLQQILENQGSIWQKYKHALLLTAGIFLILAGFYFRLDYTTIYDRQFLRHAMKADGATRDHMTAFIQALRDDRKVLFLHSMIRSLLFIAAAALITGLYLKRKIKTWILLTALGVLTYTDLITIDLQYLNNNNYKPAATAPTDQVATAADQLILRDTGYYRVFDLRYGAGYTLGYGAATAWFHRSIGGYNAAKLSIYQDLIERQLSSYPRCQPVVDMLNTRYLIGPGDTVIHNEGALGPAWFVKGIKYARSPEEMMNALSGLSPKDTAVLMEKDKLPALDAPSPADSIWLTDNNNDEMTYGSSSRLGRFAVFSEVWYNGGWKAYIDGAETPIFRANYVLRGLPIPAGRHTIRFAFHPGSYYLGQIVQRVAGILTLLLLISMIYIKLIYSHKAKTA
ncbi:YfhO family protein [Flavitalea sp. BT771]|uniref:YfhO family protein n=1 Tax=Flavitalea sp. BT771 TaxID=3063329 RepID=UPI0026E11A33|nr:YfhO family protein [Flavitalea sp. BT771]MDO6435389.1 YfhO family protein [Flavitalea sp. BT771]MDV6224251.1 YfhO family protein [Flavitalea sp. BT771]